MPTADYDRSVIGRALAQPARAAILAHLMDGQAHDASTLAAVARVSAPAATAHLKHLVAANLITVTASGRQRLHALVSPEVAAAIEALAAISPPKPVDSLRQARTGSQLRQARVCFGHLGGALAVAVTRRLVDAAVVDAPRQGRAGPVHHADDALLAALDITGPAVNSMRGCLDWTEQVPHLGGPLGSALLSAMLAAGWLRRRRSSRALTVTSSGTHHLVSLGLQHALLQKR